MPGQVVDEFTHPVRQVPGWLAYPVSIAQIAGGTLLLAGIAVRTTTLGLLPILLGATFVHFGSGWVFSNPNGGWQYPAFLVGPGRFVLRLPRAAAATSAVANRLLT